MKQTSYLIQDLLSEETSLFPSFDISVSKKNICFKIHTLAGTAIVIDINDNFSRIIERHGSNWATPDYKSILPKKFSDKLKASLASIGYTKHSWEWYTCCDTFVTVGPIAYPNQNQPNLNMLGGHTVEGEVYRAQLQSAMEQQQRQFQDGLVQMNKLREQQQRSFVNPNNHGFMSQPLSMSDLPGMSGMSGMNNPINPYLPSPAFQFELQQIRQTHNILSKSVLDLQTELTKLQAEIKQFKDNDKIED